MLCSNYRYILCNNQSNVCGANHSSFLILLDVWRLVIRKRLTKKTFWVSWFNISSKNLVYETKTKTKVWALSLRYDEAPVGPKQMLSSLKCTIKPNYRKYLTPLSNIPNTRASHSILVGSKFYTLSYSFVGELRIRTFTSTCSLCFFLTFP